MTTCQHCGVEAPDERTYCPSCKRRLRAAAPRARTTRVSAARAQSKSDPWAWAAEPWAPATESESEFETPGLEGATQVPARVRGWLGIATVCALTAIAATDVWLFLADRHDASVADTAAATGQGADLAALSSADDAVVTATVAHVALVLLAGVLFIAWLFHLARLVDQLTPDALRYHPGWAIGGWFVPILNLFRPKQMVDDVWSGSSPELIRGGSPAYLHLWWAAVLVTGAFGWVVALSGDDTVQGIASSERLAAWSDLTDLVAACLAIAVVLMATRRVRLAVSRARATAAVAAFAG